jgi:hypothetical protein
MTTRLGEQLRAIAEQFPSAGVPADLYERARRRHRTRAVFGAAGAGVLLVAAVAALVAGPPAGGLIPVGAGRSGARVVVDSVGGPPGWAALALLLAALRYVWRHQPRAIMRRRMVLTAAVGVVFVLAAPPATAVWGEPYRAPGLPDRLASPFSWTLVADVRQSPPGPVALIFSGPATYGNLEEGRLAMVAANGERYRVLDVFTDPLESSFRAGQSVAVDRFTALLSPDGRYLLGDGMLDLVTGGRGPQPPGLPVGWSADGRRVVSELFNADQTFEAREVWDLRTGQVIARIEVNDPSRDGTAALSSDGERLAVEIGDGLRIYDVGDPARYHDVPLDGWRLGGPAAWSPDNRMLALVRPGTPWVRLVATPVDAVSILTPVAEFTALPPGTVPRLQGWRSNSEVVVQAGRAVVSFGVDRPTPERLIDLPEGVTRVEIATAALTRPLYRAGPPTYGPPNLFFWIVVAPLVSFGVVLAVVVVGQRLRGRRHGPLRGGRSGSAASR